MFKHEENKKAIDVIMDTFSGGDPAKFVRFKFGMESIEEEDSYASNKIMGIMQSFAKLILVLQKKEEDL